MKRCECGNKIDPRDLGEDATQCEWCEYPEVPIYKINEFGEEIHLYFVGMNGIPGVRIKKGLISAIAPSKESARLILEDYLNKEGN